MTDQRKHDLIELLERIAATLVSDTTVTLLRPSDAGDQARIT